MPSRSHLTRPKPRNVTIDLGEGDSLNVTFDANRITPAWMSEVQTREEAQDSYTLPKALAEVMIGWDVTEDDGSQFAPTAENIGCFSFSIQTELLEQILRAATPSSEEGNASTNTSATPTPVFMPVQENLQNGPQPSPSPQPSTVESKT